ncbi:MAG: M20/M25/M40 family metallo-hydrolase [bacterium]
MFCNRVLVSTMATFFVAAHLFAFSPPKGAKKPAFDFNSARIPMLSITLQESQFHVNVLASEEFQGRRTGTPGQWLAAKYIAEEFSSYGLVPAGDNGTFYQNFGIAHIDLAHAAMWLESNSRQPGEKMEFSLKDDFIPMSFTGEYNVAAEVVFAGYGITAPEYGYDDYAAIDVRGKIVFVLRHEPREYDPTSIFDGRNETRHARPDVKAENAIKHGAIAMLLVTDPARNHGSMAPRGYWPSLHSRGGRLPRRWELDSEPVNKHFQVIWIGATVAKAILRHTGFSLLTLQTNIDKTLRPQSFQIYGPRVHLETRLDKDVHSTQNVVGFLRGADPDRHDEVVVIGAHYDHIGMQNGLIHPGADDNASGTAGLLEIAEAFTETPVRPRRSVLFIAFSAEELGLLGSQYYVEHAVMPLERTATMVNLDMIGRNHANRVTIVGGRRSPELYELNLAANEEVGLNLFYDGEKYFNRSDQANFAKYNIPVIFYNTKVHEDYHRPTDSAEKINPEKLARVARLAFLVSWKVANLDVWPTYRPFDLRH